MQIFAEKVKSVLNDEGIALIMTPNGERIIDRGDWYDVVGEHLNYFSFNSLCKLFIESGFRICDCRVIRDGWWLRIVVKKKKQIDFDRFFLKKNDDLSHLIKYSTLKRKTSLWGAGVKGACFLESISGKIDFLYIFDSNPVKSGKMIPGSKIRIVEPEFEKINENDTIIISALENRHVIEQTLRDTFRFKGDIVAIDELVKLL